MPLLYAVMLGDEPDVILLPSVGCLAEGIILRSWVVRHDLSSGVDEESVAVGDHV